MALLQIRVDDELKNQAKAIYNELGIDLSTAVRMFLKKSIIVGGIPFELKADVPNKETLLALNELQEMNNNPEKYKKYDNVDDLMEDLIK